MADDLSVTGVPLNRIDGPLKVSGRAPYAADYLAQDLVHGAVVSSRVAAGSVRAIDAAAARAFPGVIAVYTHQDHPPAAPAGAEAKAVVGLPGEPYRPLQDGRIRFADQPVALVLAESYEAARDAAALVRVTYDEAPSETDLERAAAGAYEPAKRRFGPLPDPRGDADAAFAAAPVKISARYLTAPEYHNPMELFATTAVWEGGGKLTVYDKNQGSQKMHLYLAAALDAPREDIRVVNAYVGGAFGAGLRPSHAIFLAALAARRLQRSVQLVLTRAQMFALTLRPHAIQDMALACDTEGRLQAIKHDVVAATSTYEDMQEPLVDWSGLLYACPNVAFGYRLAKLATPTPGDMRAPGAATGVFALECAMDELAHAAGLDPLALRLANWVDYDQNENVPISSKALRECYAQAAERFGWSRRSAQPRSMREGRELVGWGMASGVWEAMVAPRETFAKATWRADGKLEIAAAASDIGTGTYTILAQIAAEAFGLSAAQVDVRIGDSSLPDNPVEGGSWMAASTGSATAEACEKLKGELLEAARHTHQLQAGEVEFADGRLVGPGVPGGALSIAEVVRAQGGDLSAMGSCRPKSDKSFSSYTHSAVFAEVRVDEELGVVRVTRVVTAVAAGRILNPKTARSQILGAVVMGVGRALHEEGVFDHRSGRMMTHSLADYHVPVHADIRDIEVIFVEEHDPKVSPLGVKGVGEIGIVGVAPAVANAVFHATGKRVRDLPITLDKLLDALG